MFAIFRNCAVLAVIGSAGWATASELTVEFSGYMGSVATEFQGTGIAVGDPFHGRLRYDSLAPPDPAVSSESQAEYLNSIREITLVIEPPGDSPTVLAASGGKMVVFAYDRFYGVSSFGQQGLEDDVLAGAALEGLWLLLQNSDGRPQATSALPLELALADFTAGSSLIDVVINDESVLEGIVTRLVSVPEPGSLLLFSVALFFGAVAYARRR